MARKSLNRDRYEAKLGQVKHDPAAYAEMLAKSPFRRHQKRILALRRQAEVLTALKHVDVAEEAECSDSKA
ncbi:hypothetical protein GSbR_41690 [Geobacter sp. SVR]|nr:hypothetical protein GSVR_23940 [Geobacter sp. SVR]GCF87569.1 hypothetical protein GSbR_41690 [Geobacter sp. SVR]